MASMNLQMQIDSKWRMIRQQSIKTIDQMYIENFIKMCYTQAPQDTCRGDRGQL